MPTSWQIAYACDVRIFSLLPSTTEIVFDLGLADQLLGVTFECNFPPEGTPGEPRIQKSVLRLTRPVSSEVFLTFDGENAETLAR